MNCPICQKDMDLFCEHELKDFVVVYWHGDELKSRRHYNLGYSYSKFTEIVALGYTRQLAMFDGWLLPERIERLLLLK